MSEFEIKKEKYGFVYIWYDRKHKRYYIGSHWGYEDDGYICSSDWMNRAYQRRPEDFKRRILSRIYTNKTDTFYKEQEWLNLVKLEEIKIRYYNLHIKVHHWAIYPENVKTIGQKISLANKGRINGPCSEETKEKIRQSTKGVKKTYTEESYKALVETHLGNKHTDEWKENNAKMLREQWANGSRKPLSQQSEESNRKRSEKLRGRQLTIPTEESRRKQSEKRKLYWENVKAGLIPPRKPRNKKAAG